MPSSLTDPYLKIGRAKDHLESLNRELQSFQESSPYRIAEEEDFEHQLYILRLELLDVPDKIPLIVGDVIYNLRSSLDQLVFALAWQPGIVPGKVQFPIHDSLDADSRKRFFRDLTDVPPDAIKEIDSLQPYQRPSAIQSHLLWRLNAMCNLDKHRRIPANGSELIFQLPQVDGIISWEVLDKGGIVRFPLSMKNKVQLNPSISFKVNFGDPHYSVVVDAEGISRIYEFIRDSVLPRFAGFFP